MLIYHYWNLLKVMSFSKSQLYRKEKKMAKKTTWTPKNKTYGAFKDSNNNNTSFYGVKLVGKDSPREEGKSAFFIMQRTDVFGNGKKLHEKPLTHYPAIMQFKQIIANNPDALKKGKYKLNANGTIPKALIDLLGTDKVAKEIDGVMTLAQCKEEMKSWT